MSNLKIFFNHGEVMIGNIIVKLSRFSFSGERVSTKRKQIFKMSNIDVDVSRCVEVMCRKLSGLPFVEI